MASKEEERRALICSEVFSCSIPRKGFPLANRAGYNPLRGRTLPRTTVKQVGARRKEYAVRVEISSPGRAGMFVDCGAYRILPETGVRWFGPLGRRQTAPLFFDPNWGALIDHC